MPNVNCKICRCAIEEEELKHVYYDPDHPTIDIGPYCSTCMGTIRICNGCHEPHQLDITIKYFNNGRFYCHTCASNLELCSSCGKETTIHQVVDGTKFCKECFVKYFQKCDCCEGLKHKTAFVTDNFKRVSYPGLFKKYKDCCEECFESKKSRFLKVDVGICNNCHTHYRKKAGDKGYCARCYSNLPSCTVCKEKSHLISSVPVDDSFGPSSYVHMCLSCASKHVKCDCCGRTTKSPLTEKGIFKPLIKCTFCVTKEVGQCSICLNVSRLTDGVCSTCTSLYTASNRCGKCSRIKDSAGSCRVCNGAKIYNYSTKPVPFFMYDKEDRSNKNVMFLGIENEITFNDSPEREDALKSLYRSYSPDFLIAKSDASISGCGFEVVTQPMTFSKFQEKDLSGMFFVNMERSSSCGMHVHVGRSAFLSDVHLFKVCQFIHKNQKFSDYISERSVNHYSGDFEDKVSKAVKNSKRGHGHRNLRVNLTNSSTVEFRMFAGATTEVQMRQRVEFLHALVEWTKNISIKEVSVDTFVSYVNSNKKKYSNLVTFLAKRKK